MTKRSVVLLVGLIGIASTFACEDDPVTGGGPGTDGGVNTPSDGALGPTTAPPRGAAGEFCQGTLGVIVSAFDSCCSAGDKETTDYMFMRGLVSELLPRCTSALEASIAKSRVLYRAAETDACFAAYRTNYASGNCQSLTQTFADPSGPSCREAFTGVGQAGAACAGDHECVDGLTCVGYTKDADGSCKAPPAIGEACGPGGDADAREPMTLAFGSHPACAPGARCDLVSSQCVKANGEGEACSSTDECSTSLHCVRKKCQAAGPGGEGAVCLDNEDCTPDSFCAGADGVSEGTCAKKRPAGGACTGAVFVTECSGRCDAELGSAGACVSFCGSP